MLRDLRLFQLTTQREDRGFLHPSGPPHFTTKLEQWCSDFVLQLLVALQPLVSLLLHVVGSASFSTYNSTRGLFPRANRYRRPRRRRSQMCCLLAEKSHRLSLYTDLPWQLPATSLLPLLPSQTKAARYQITLPRKRSSSRRVVLPPKL